MYRKEKRIPTLLALFLLLTGIAGALYFDGTYQSITSKAGAPVTPGDVHMTNLSDNSITVSYLTDKESVGAISVSGPNMKLNLIDDKDLLEGTKARLTHMFTVKNLKSDSGYTIIVTGGIPNCNPSVCPEFIQKTGVKIEKSLDLPPVSGQIVDVSRKPVDGAIVYLLIGRAAPLSARSDKTGKFAIPLNNLRSQDLKIRPDLNENVSVQITIKSSSSDHASVLTDIVTIKKNPMLGELALGKSYNYISGQNTGDIIRPEVLGKNTQIKLTPTPKQELSKKGFDFVFPRYKLDTTIDTNPKIRGIGMPNQKIKISVKSTVQTETVTVASDGTWEYRPKLPLSPGMHTISITGKDNTGATSTLTREFVVLKSGEAVLGDSTPSASLTPTTTDISPTTALNISISPSAAATISATLTPVKSPTPTLTPSPTFTPSPTPTPTPTPSPTPSGPLPRAGSLSLPSLLIGSGITLLLVGLKFLF